MVVRAFEGPDRAQTALAELKDAGVRPEQISVVARDPGVSRRVIEGSGMDARGVPGCLVDVLMAHGVPEKEARGYEERLKRGQILLIVRADRDEEVQRADRVFEAAPGALEPWRDFEYAIENDAVAFEQLAYAHLARRPEFETRHDYRAQARYYYRDLLTSFCKRHGNITDMYDRYWPPDMSSAGIFAIVTSQDELWIRYFKRAFDTAPATAAVEDFLGCLYAEARTALDVLPPGASRHNHILSLFALTYSTLVLLDTLLSTDQSDPPAATATRSPFSLSFRGVTLAVDPPRQAAVPAPRPDVLSDLKVRFANLRGEYEAVAQREARRKYFQGMLMVLLALILAVAFVAVLVAGVLGAVRVAGVPGVVPAGRVVGYHPAAVLDFALPVIAGGIGAVFSVLNRVASGAFALDWRLGWKANRELGYYRPLIGGIIGLALVFLLKGALLVVSVAPSANVLFTYTGLAFLAGFSERFAAVVLARSETQAVPAARDPAASGPAPAAGSSASGRAASPAQADVAATPAQDPGRPAAASPART